MLNGDHVLCNTKEITSWDLKNLVSLVEDVGEFSCLKTSITNQLLMLTFSLLKLRPNDGELVTQVLKHF